MPESHVNVLIVGAGLSGVGAACHLLRDCPRKSFRILEARERMGGTWDLFRYPGIRSDSDMFTLGYDFRPWRDPKAIADGPSILSYIRETASEFRLDEKIEYRTRVVRADWSSKELRWKVEFERTDSGERSSLTADFVYCCTGYYRYDQGYTPHFPGADRFRGQIVHPQHWPEGFDYSGKRVVVIGSGATAVTLVPAMTDKAAHVTMLQRTPAYVVSMPAQDWFANLARKLLPERLAYRLSRWKAMNVSRLSFKLSRRYPKLMKSFIRRAAQKKLPAGYDVQTHFQPSYDPWDQRLCLVPDDDLFEAIRLGKASVVTDRIETFTERGIKLVSGGELEADVIVTATGLQLLFLGGIQISVDGQPVDVPRSVAYKGMMLSGVPNAALAVGYTNASWTLKVDLVSHYVCRLLNHMDAHGFRTVTPVAPDPSLPTSPIIDLKSGYVLRSLDMLPQQGERLPWRLNQDYPLDVKLLREAPVDDEGVRFGA